MAKGRAAAQAKGPTGRRLTKKERHLADLKAAGFSGAEAAMVAYETTSPDTARSIASEVLNKPDVRAYLEGKAHRAAEIVMHHAENAESEMVSLIAAKDVLDRTGFKTPESAKDPNQGATYNFIFSAETQASVKQIEDTIRARLTALPHAQENRQNVEAQPQGPGEAGPAAHGS